MAKHFILDIGEDRLSWRRDQDGTDAEAALDGIYVIRTPLPGSQLDAAGTVTACQGPLPRRAGLPLDQSRRPGPAPDPPLARRPRPRPRADLHARRLPHLAPAPSPGPADLHRRAPPTQGSPVKPARRSA